MTTRSIVWIALLAGAVAHAGQPQYKLSVCLLDRANDGYLNYALAETLASRIFAVIGIGLEWGKSKPNNESPQPPILIEAVTKTPTSLMPGSLGYAVSQDSHITVFIDRIEQMRTPSTVLAHVMVHEITHILQGIGRHSATGVMKEVWTAADFGGIRLRPLYFTPLDIDLIYSGLAAGRTSQKGENE